MYLTEELPAKEKKWAITGDSDQPVFYIEWKRPRECSVRISETHKPGGRGRLLATFLGADPLEGAVNWLEKVGGQRLLKFTPPGGLRKPKKEGASKETPPEIQVEVLTAI